MLEKIINTISQFDKVNVKNPDQVEIEGIIAQAYTRSKPIELITFTCSTINSQFMFDKTNFEKYVKLDADNNNLLENIPIINELSQQLRSLQQKIKLTILIGNTDPFYIYSRQLQELPGIKKEKYFIRFSKRWKQYAINLEIWLSKRVKGYEFEVVNWYEFQKEQSTTLGLDFDYLFEKTYINIESYFSRRILNEELEKLKNAFGPGEYFENLERPKETILQDWVKRKFAEYATQGLWIKLLWAKGILLQNEKPALLRYEMYQPLIRKYLNSTLPNLFLYGITGGYA